MSEVNEEKRKCFIITPIGERNSSIYRHIEGVIGTVIKPLLEKYNFSDIKAAHQINESGSINNQLISRILNDDLVIANLTGNNSNVMYELAIRHATGRPIIHICEEGTVLPFDLKGERTIFYTNDIKGAKELEEGINEFLESIEYDKQYLDNPIYNAQQSDMLIKSVQGNEPMELIVNKLEKLTEEVSSLKKVNESPTTVHDNMVYEYKNILRGKSYVDENSNKKVYNNTLKIGMSSPKIDPAFGITSIKNPFEK